MKRAIIIGACVALGLTACGDDNTQLDDATVGVVDDTPQFVMTNLDGFPNVAFRCFEGPDVTDGVPTGVYTTTRETDNLKLVINDPQCPGYDPAIPTVVTR